MFLYPKRYSLIEKYYICTRKGIIMEDNSLSTFVKTKRKETGMTQIELSEKSGVGLRFVRKLEQGNTNLQMDKVNQVLALFGCELGAVKIS